MLSSIRTIPPATAPEQFAQDLNLPIKSDRAIDQDLVTRFLDGNEEAFIEIMARHRGKIYAAVLRLIRDHGDAEELTQDTFIRAHRGLGRFRGDSSLETWLRRIAINLSRNRYWYWFRRHRKDSMSMEAPMNSECPATFSDLVADIGQDPAQSTVAAEFAALVARCMKLLDPRQCEILRLRGSLDLSYEEISARLGVTSGTVKSRISRARMCLRIHLAEICPDFANDTAHNDWFLPSRALYGCPRVACA